MKTIVAIWNGANTGKTETIRELANLLVTTYPNYITIYPIPIQINPKYDFRLVIEINGVIIGLESQGDPSTNLEKRLDDMVNSYQCNLVFCTTRTRGETVWAVNNIAKKYSSEIIWTSTYQVNSSNTSPSILNTLKAKHLLDLIQQLNII